MLAIKAMSRGSDKSLRELKTHNADCLAIRVSGDVKCTLPTLAHAFYVRSQDRRAHEARYAV